jgi:hypothetical protein
VASFIDRVERFEADVAILWFEFRVSGAGAEVVNQSPGGEDACDANGYRCANRLGPRPIANINALFADDLERFGYQKLEPSAVPKAG